MNVLATFDGLGGGRIALDRADIPVTNYFASEIDKFAIQASRANWNDITQVGDICKLSYKNGVLSNGTQSFNTKIDILIGGFPCQSLSRAGDGTGLNGKSGLFWEFIRLLKETKPKYFFVENVKMKKEWSDIITTELGVEPILINSSLVSAQNRERLYWTNIPNITQPQDKGILLKDILEPWTESIDNPKRPATLKNSYTITNSSGLQHVADASDIKGHQSIKRIYSANGKAPTLTTMGGGHREPKVLIGQNDWYRKLTPLECERLQTLPDNYTQGLSKTQRYKTIGNGWTIDVITHIFKGII